MGELCVGLLARFRNVSEMSGRVALSNSCPPTSPRFPGKLTVFSFIFEFFPPAFPLRMVIIATFIEDAEATYMEVSIAIDYMII